MGVSVATIRRMEGAELRPVIVDGKHCFQLEEIDQHRRMTDGDLAARAFELFNEDRTQVDVVIALKESPERIRRLFQDWVEMSDCVVVGPPGPGRRRMRRCFQAQLTRSFLWGAAALALRDPSLKQRVEQYISHRALPDG
jgi:hypothetical protein